MTSGTPANPSISGRSDLRAALRTIVLGSEPGDRRRGLRTGLALGLFGTTFFAYELGIFFDSSGIVFISFHAAIVGVIATFWAGYARNGLLFGWVLTYLSFLGWHAEWATEISVRSLANRVAYFVRPDGLLALTSIGLIVAVVGFTAGALTRRGIDTLRAGSRPVIDS